jgi:hypothetical protein
MREPKIAGFCAQEDSDENRFTILRPGETGYTMPASQALTGQISLESLASARGWKMILGCPGSRGLTSRQYKIYNSTYEAGNKVWLRASGDLLGCGYLDYPHSFR